MSFFKKKVTLRRNLLVGKLDRFAREEDGMVTILALFMIMMMVLIGGIQLDFMRHELERSKLQAVSDRAVLAAASIDQELDPAKVVQDYFAKSGMSGFLSSTSVSEGANYRVVTVDASKEMKTQFIGRLGFDTLNVPAHSQAEERVPKVEISLVLDISGSMNNNGKLLDMQTSAKGFVNIVLERQTDNISVSLVPYSEQVNVGPDIFDALWVDTRHKFSYCIDVPDGHFVQTQMTPGFPWDQTQHVQFDSYPDGSSYGSNTKDDPLYETVCPRDSHERVRPISQDKQAIINQIDNLKPRVGKAIYMGMKWGTALLDPSFRQTTAELVAQYAVDPTFADRPADYDDKETQKHIVLLTDGQNSPSLRISEQYYNNPSEYVHWSKNIFWDYLKKEVRNNVWHQYYYTRYSSSVGDTLTDKICTAAKKEGITIWTVGFQVEDHGASVMQKCASSPSHFFRVDHGELSIAFEAIARSIKQLRLTQ